LFLDNLGEPWKKQSMDLIRAAGSYVDAFLPVSKYYFEYMPGYLGIPQEKMRLVPLGINLDGYAPRPPRGTGPFTIGYFARIAPEKGLHVLADAYRRLRTRPGLGPSRLVVAGYLAPEHRAYLEGITRDLKTWGLGDQFEYRGEVDRHQKIEFLRSLDVLSVPATYEEPKGIFLLEAMACGIPVVQPRRGAFPEVVETTGGGMIIEADNPEALADGFQALWRDPALAAQLAAAGVKGVREHYNVERMAESAEAVYSELTSRSRRATVV
jgi:glycosyltransferase involved in cell wall biosynthesis